MSWQQTRQSMARAVKPFPALLLVTLIMSALAPHSVLSADEDDEQARRQELLPNFLPRNRRLREMLTAVDQLRTQGRSAEALKTVQWILDQPFDAFVLTEQKFPVSVKALAEKKLRSFPEEWRRQYERTFGLEARQLLNDALHQDDERLANETLRRYRMTAAAEDAATWLAGRWLDRGEVELAMATLLPGISTEASLRDVSSHRLSAAFSLSLAAKNESLSRAIQSELEDRTDLPATQALQRPTPPVPNHKNHRSVEILDASAGQGDEMLTRGSIPVIRPRWTDSLIGPRNRSQLVSMQDSWRNHLQSLNLVPVSPHVPLVVRNQVITRNDEGICGFDLMSGEPLWKFPCESSFSNWIDEISQQGRQGGDFANFVPADTLQWWFGSNTQLGYLSSDGIRLYVVDSLGPPTGKSSGRQDAFQARATDPERRQQSNRLLALELPTVHRGKATAPPNLVWASAPPRALPEAKNQGRFFFGPPVAHAGRLYSVVETDREVRLLAMQAETGTVFWEQPLVSVDRAAVHDGERAYLACVPVPAGDLMICPTHTGVLTAVDAITGALRWSYFDGDLPIDPMERQRRVSVSRGRSGFAPRTVVRNDFVVHLPGNSSDLHLLDRETGRLMRTIARQRACSLATVTPELAVFLESHGCRAVKLADGSEVWRQKLPPVTGTGAVLGSELLVPLDQGRFALLEIATGRPFSWLPQRTGISLGNLTVCGDIVLSQGPDGIAVFPQAELVRRTLAEQPSSLSPVDQALLSVELNFSLGQLADAEKSLEIALANPLPSSQQREMQHLLREMLYARLEAEPDRAGAVFASLSRLVVTAEDQGRLLSLQGRQSVESQDLTQLQHVLEEFSRLPPGVVFPSAADPAWLQSSAACCRQLLAEVEGAQPEFARKFRANLLRRHLSEDRPRSQRSGWEFALQVGREDPQAAELRDQLARSGGRKHVAELLWLQNLRGNNPLWAAEAAVGLMDLWNQSGWPRDSAKLLHKLSQTWPEVRLRSGQTGRDYVESLPIDSEARQWQLRAAAPRGRIHAVSMRLSPELELPNLKSGDEGRNRTFGAERSRDGDQPRKLEPIDSLSTEVQVQPGGRLSILSVVEKATSQMIHQWRVPSPISHPFARSEACQAHYFPLGVQGGFRGYSLLEIAEESPVWSRTPPELARQNSVCITGPGGPSFATFQIQNSIYVCNPADGAILWQRAELDPNCGLYPDPITGIIGDEQCLVVFAADRANYTVYDTLTGERLRKGQWEAEQSQTRRTAFGRKLLRVSRERGQWMARIWDPLTDKYELQELLGDRNYLLQTISATEVAWMTAKGEVFVHDVPRGLRTFEAQLPEEELEQLNSLQFIKHCDRLLVNLQRNTPLAQTRDYNTAFERPAFLSVKIRDDLFALDGRTGRMLWKQTVPHRTLLRLDPPGLPFLVLLSQVRDKHDGNQLSLLAEVRDANSGEVIARQDHLAFDRIMNVDYDGVERTVTLLGQKSRVKISWATDQIPAAME